MCLHEPMPTCLKLATWRLHILWKENKSLPCLSHFHCVSTLILANAVITHVHIQYFLRLYKLLYLSFCFQFSSVTKSRPTIRNPMNCSRPCFPVHHHSQSLCKFMSIESVIPSKHLILCRPSPPTFNLSQHQGLFQWVSSSHPVAKVLEFIFSISASNEYSVLISFRVDWLDPPAFQGILKSLLQHNSKASILRHLAFFIVQNSHPYMTTGNTIALTRHTFVGKVISLFLNMQSRLFIAFLPRRKHFLISWLQSPSATILEPKK